MKPLLLVLALAVVGGATTASQATGIPEPLAGEPKIRVIRYDPDGVVQLKAYLGYQLMLEFGGDERIENVAIGDATSWQITPNRRADLLFIKPLAPLARTNLTVVTDIRRYALELSAADDSDQEDLAYIVRYQYPQPPGVVAAAASPKPPNTAYRTRGARNVTPAEIFDDGRFTYFRWDDGVPQPAIYVLGPDGHENLANSGVEGAYVVVDQIAPQFSLRAGAQTATVVNRGFVRRGVR